MSANSTTHIPPEKAFHINVLTELTASRLHTHAATKHTKRQDTYTPTTHRSKIQSDNSVSTTANSELLFLAVSIYLKRWTRLNLLWTFCSINFTPLQNSVL